MFVFLFISLVVIPSALAEETVVFPEVPRAGRVTFLVVLWPGADVVLPVVVCVVVSAVVISAVQQNNAPKSFIDEFRVVLILIFV